MRSYMSGKNGGNGTAAKRKNKSFNWLRLLVLIFAMCFVVVCGAVVGFVTASLKGLPDQLDSMEPAAASQFFDNKDNLIATTKSEEHRIPVKLSLVPKHVRDAFIAIEDIRFYQHIGIDPRAIMRAAWSNITNTQIAEGGSTITQQLVKNTVLTQEQTLTRKVQEAFVSLQIEKKYSKSEILEMYLNQIYFGKGAYGVQAASRIYFGKDVDNLSLAQGAMLAGIPKSPNAFSPLNNFTLAKSRQEIVIDQMVRYKFITPEQAKEAKEETIDITSHRQNSPYNVLDYYIDYVTQIVITKFGADALYKEGLKIYTSIDMRMQQAAEEAMKNVPVYGTDKNGLQQPQSALVAIDPRDGFIKAMVGGRGTDKFNRAVLAVRQPGSAFKPFVYLAAIDSGYTPAMIIDDKDLELPGEWSPRNYDMKFHGRMSMRTALVRSYNVPAVFLTQQVTPEKVIDIARKMGISTLVLSGSVNDVNLAMALGGLTRGVSPLEMASSFGIMAQNGLYAEPLAVLKVVDRNNKVIFNARVNTQQIIPPRVAYSVTDMLKDVITRGTGTAANIGRPAAGKTGTTSDYKDAWFVGYTPDLSTAVWIGHDSGGDLRRMTGGDLPAQLWRRFMSEALKDSPAQSFTRPQGVIIPPDPVITQDDEDPALIEKNLPGATPPIRRPPSAGRRNW